MAYVPTDPTGPPPAHLLAMNENQLVDILKAHADALLTNGRLNVTPILIGANHQIKHIIEIIMERCRQVDAARIYAEERAIQAEEDINHIRDDLGISQDILRKTQDDLNELLDDIRTLHRRREALQRERDALQNDVGNLNYLIQELQTRQRRIREHLQLVNNRLTGQLANIGGQLVNANNLLQIEQLTTINLGRIRARLTQRNAALRIQVIWFRNRQLNPPPLPLPQDQITWLPLH